MPATSSSTIFWVSVIRCLRSLSCSPIGGSLFSRASSAFLRAWLGLGLGLGLELGLGLGLG